MSKPSIFIGTMVKNSDRWLDQYWEVIKKLTYPKNKIRLVFMYAISTDFTLEKIEKFSKENIVNVEVYREPVNNELRAFGAQGAAAVYNDFKHLIDEDYFMLFDSDIVGIKPNNLIEELLKVKTDIVAPYPYSEGYRHFYDSWIWRINNVRLSPEDPPAKDSAIPIEVDSVGTCFLSTREVWTSSPIANPYPNLTFCLSAKRLGYKVVGCPYLHVIHKDIEKLGIKHNPLPPKFGFYPAPGWIDSKYPVKEFKVISEEDKIKEAKSDIDEGLKTLKKDIMKRYKAKKRGEL